ncbi:VIT1/CCC1 transporter family protein [Cellulomonas oligotrophica]|uniref:Membrane protein n=1 Tax=Cellulomonas oligotrophica TaxID=931536 RepID=A0A7Y9FI36_9CELL|nr:VIT1/CCC1 transporter family protein [Cellulomonas oligotrophica]NYD87714.1 VIT1/CCC1 family predicted Fe2+/Mn2+ transporter [Cellulomonas oligotrophica]GIG33081.1 membrane protein [Cellulomonas oligotrophica]
MTTIGEHLRTPLGTPAPGSSARPDDAPPAPHHAAQRLNWLRAGVLGANDGIVSIAATVVGVAGAAASTATIGLAGGAALLAGALSMAAGEYVSVSSQRDAERVAAAAGRPIGGADSEEAFTNPWHAALASLLAFTAGGLVPLLVVLAPWAVAWRVPVTFAAVLVALVLTGWASARFTGASHRRAVARNVLGGSVAMAVTYGIGTLVGTAV